MEELPLPEVNYISFSPSLFNVWYDWIVSTPFTDNHLLKKIVSGYIWVVVGHPMSKDHCLSVRYPSNAAWHM